MPPRLPTPGGDDNNWGELLNEFLEVAHNPDGTLKNASQLEALADDLVAARSDLNTVTAEVTTLSTTLTPLSTQMSTVSTDLTAVKSDVASLSTSVTEKYVKPVDGIPAADLDVDEVLAVIAANPALIAQFAASATTRVVVTKDETHNVWPARPVGAAFVEWVGTGSPQPPAGHANDTWLDTTP